MKTTSQIIQENVEATDHRNAMARKAIRAVEKAWRDTEAFDHGGMASNEILDVIRKAINEEFRRA